MRKLADQSGVNAPDADYLKGSIQDKQTPVNEPIMGDIIEFFQKMVSLSGITENEDPDNESNGHQLIEALKAIGEGNWTEVDSEYNTGITPTYSSPDVRNLKYRKNLIGYVEIVGAFTTAGIPTSPNNILTLPTGFRPDNAIFCTLNGTGTEHGDIRIDADGQVRFLTTLSSGGTFYMNISFPIKD